MNALDQLFALEVEFQRRVRIEAPGRAEASAIHTSYAMQLGYEQLLRQIVGVADREVDRLAERSGKAGDSRDVLAACDSLKQLLGLGVAE